MHKLATEYKKTREIYVDLTQFAIGHLQNCLATQKLKHMKTEFRTKEITSLDKKMSDQKINISNLQDIQDLSAVRVITLLEKQAGFIVSSLRNYFGADNCLYTPKYAKDGYNADHLVVTVAKSLTRKKKIKNFMV